jgi:DNA-binding NarL/FixJ family response regulator
VIRVVIADDQTAVREGIATLVGLINDIEVVGMARNGDEAVQLATDLGPDVVLMDLRMPDLDGVGATGQIREALPNTHVLVLTTYADDNSLFPALEAGARGYLTKDASSEEIQRAIRDAARGRTRLDHAVQERLVELVTAGPTAPATPTGPMGTTLTDRETEVLRLMADSLGNRDIAQRLFVTEATVKTHVNNIFGKLGVGDRAAAVAWAFRSGVASP